MKCPGQDTRYWKADAVSEAKCPRCGSDVEFFKDDTTRRCPACGHRFVNPAMDFGCASYCRYAEQCLGALPEEIRAKRDDMLKDRVAIEVKEDLFGRGKMKVKRNIIQIDEERCDGCGLCVPACAEGAIEIIDGKARLVADKFCDGLGACLGECPNDALRVIERQADEFDEEAVEKHLGAKEVGERPAEPAMPCGCPSAQVQAFAQPAPCEQASRPWMHGRSGSALCHWPVQIRLVPSNAPFLKGAKLLVAADCVPVAYPDFHQDFLQGRAVMVGCPKFDDVKGYIEKFAEIFSTADIKEITVAVIEVPCCQGLPVVLEKAMKKAGKKIPIDKVVISTRGEILNRERLVP